MLDFLEPINFVTALVGVVGLIGALGFTRPSVPRSAGLEVVKDDPDADLE